MLSLGKQVTPVRAKNWETSGGENYSIARLRVTIYLRAKVLVRNLAHFETI